MTMTEATRLGLKWKKISRVTLGDGAPELKTLGRSTARVNIHGKAPAPMEFMIVESLVAPIIIGLSGGEVLGFGVMGLPLILPERAAEALRSSEG